MFFISFKLTFFVLIFIPFSGWIITLLGKNLKKKSARIQKEQGDFLTIIDETVNGQKIIKTFGAGKQFKNKFYAATQRFYNFSNQLLHRASLAGPASEFLGVSAIGVLLWFGGRMVLLDESISGTTFIAFIGLAYNILTPAKGISKASYSIQKGNAASDRILEILNAANRLKDVKSPVILKSFKNSIVFHKVFFSYENKPVINNLSFEIRKGEMVALVGPSGSGKTTLTHLINRFYDIDKGVLSIDNIPINKIQKKSLYKHIGMVTQESILFNDTVFNNLDVVNLNVTGTRTGELFGNQSTVGSSGFLYNVISFPREINLTEHTTVAANMGDDITYIKHEVLIVNDDVDLTISGSTDFIVGG